MKKLAEVRTPIRLIFGTSDLRGDLTIKAIYEHPDGVAGRIAVDMSKTMFVDSPSEILWFQVVNEGFLEDKTPHWEVQTVFLNRDCSKLLR